MLNVLVCDDDKEIVDAIEIYLVQEGYNVLKAYDGVQALEMLKENEVHLLIIDISPLSVKHEFVITIMIESGICSFIFLI